MAKKKTTPIKKASSGTKSKKNAVKKKTTASKTVKKAATKLTTRKTATAVKKKTTVTKSGKKSNMIKSKTRKKETDNMVDEISSAAARAKALGKIKGYSKKDLEHFKKIILDKQNEILEQLQNLKDQMMDPTTGEYINENSPYSLHMAEQGTDAMEREKTFLYAQRENKFLGYLEDALKRIDAGTYGICIDCIENPKHLCDTCPLIPKARLEAVPHSQLCLPIKQKQEKK
ncbi:MAG: conjugal transfer protein TraR [Ignavibacteriaceae bacterium]